jgi:hypothetical protein
MQEQQPIDALDTVVLWIQLVSSKLHKFVEEHPMNLLVDKG